MKRFHFRDIQVAQVAFLLALFFLVFTLHRQTQAAANDSLPSFAKIEEVVKRHVSMRKNYEPGDIISTSDVKDLFRQLKILGWKMSEKKKIYNSVLNDADFIVQQLRSSHGRRVMRKISSDPAVYDRLDRLSNLPGGKRMIHDVFRLPDAHKYFAAKPTPGLKNITQLLPKGANGKTPSAPNFEKPTGRIYTFEQLLERLRKSYLQDKKKLRKRRTQKKSNG